MSYNHNLFYSRDRKNHPVYVAVYCITLCRIVKYIVEKYFKKFNVAQTSYLECLLGRVCQWVFLMQKYKKEPRQNNCSGSLLGGPDRIRTDDPHNANVVRSQLRYKPVYEIVRCLKSLNGLIIAPEEDYVKNF